MLAKVLAIKPVQTADLIDCQGKMVISQTFLHQRHERLAFDMFGKWKTLSFDFPVAH